MVSFAERQPTQLEPGLCLVGDAWLGADKTGNVRGSGALDIQSGRNSATQVASGSNSSAFGVNNTASGYYSSAIGYINTASGYYSSAIGYINTASGYYLSLIHI